MLCGRISRYGTRFPTNYISKSTATAINRGIPPRARGRNAHAPTIRTRYVHDGSTAIRRGRGAPAAPARRPPCAAVGCALAAACAPLGNLFRSVGRVGSLPLWSCRRCPASMVAPSVLVSCGCPRFYFSAAGCPRPPSPSRVTPSPVWPRGLFPPAAGCPCRAPAAGAAAAPGGTPLGGSPFGRHSGSLRGFFFGWRGVLRAGVQGVSPRFGGPRFATLLPCPSARVAHTFFVRPGGPGLLASCSALRACAPRGGLPAAPAPLQPRRGGRCFSWYWALRHLCFV